MLMILAESEIDDDALFQSPTSALADPQVPMLINRPGLLRV